VVVNFFKFLLIWLGAREASRYAR